MSDIRNECQLECRCKEDVKLICDDEYCIRYKAYKQGKADRDKEIAEHNVFFSNKPIEDIVLDARAEVLEELWENWQGEKEAYLSSGHNFDTDKWLTHYLGKSDSAK